MESTAYLICAVVGCTLLALQVVLQLIGLGDVDLDVDTGMDVDVDGIEHADGNLFFGMLSFKTVVAFVGIFGLVGLSLKDSGYTALHRAGISMLAGLAAFFVVGFLMRGLHNLGESGSLVLKDAVGKAGTVYLRIPGQRAGRGKVTIELQGRSVELAAETDGDLLPTGSSILVVEMISSDVVRVAAAR